MRSERFLHLTRKNAMKRFEGGPTRPKITSIWENALRLFVIVLIAGLMGVGVAGAQQTGPQPVQQAPVPPQSSPRIEVLLTPYLWLPWSASTVRPNDSRIPSASSTVDPGTLISHLTWVPFMGAAELRYGPYGAMFDYIHAPVKSGVDSKAQLFSGATAGTTEDSGTAMFLYRPWAQPDQSIDVGVGVRAWGIAGDIKLNQGLLPAVSVASGLSWADPLIGGRYHRELGNGFGLTAYGDVGGFGLGAQVDWQILLTLDYRLNSWVDLRGGIRSLNFTYRAARAEFTDHMYGPIFAATFHFNP